MCTKIIITNDKRDKTQKLLEFIKKHNVFFEYIEDTAASVININADSEKLYEICCGISEYIMVSEIKVDIKQVLNKEYSCFNKDEKNIIYNSVFASEELGELSGRIYIYLKFNKVINPFGFYRFMCRDIKDSIADLVLKEADRLININDTNDFIHLLKYFSSMSPVNVKKVDVIADSSGLRICSVEGNDADYCAEFASMDISSDDILSELVNLNPNRLVIHGKEFYEKSDFFEVINGVFGERISYCNGCSLCNI